MVREAAKTLSGRVSRRLYWEVRRAARGIGYSRWLTAELQLSRIPTPTDNEAARRHFLPVGYRERPEPQYYVDDPDQEAGREYQPDVYRMAADLAESLGATTVIDVGCGRARKLAALHPNFQIIGIDFGCNIAHCSHTYRFGTWIDHDLDRSEPLPIDREVLQESVVICADVVEHLKQPEKALRALRDAAPAARAVLVSTPDRVRMDESSPAGPPVNPHHIREWTRTEFASLLRWCGFETGHLTYTRSHTGALGLTTILYVLRAPGAER